MKNFYEATVTKPNLKLTVMLTLNPNEQCLCVALVNGEVVHDGLLTVPKAINCLVPNNNPIEIKVITTRVHPEAVAIGVTVDNLPIIPLYQQYASPPTDYIDYNGEWVLTIPNFYPWYHSATGQGWIA